MIEFQIRHFSEITSTNTVLLEEAAKGASEGLVLLTDHQTKGRGKPGNIWLSPPGKNLLFSVLFRPPLRSDQIPLLTQIACRAVAKTLKEKYYIEAEFKRPNDLMAGSKKLCGILVEAASTPTKVEAVVIGIGLNVNAASEELPEKAVSMKMITGQMYSLGEILGFLLDELNGRMTEVYKTGTLR